jgi:hypothetical protein
VVVAGSNPSPATKLRNRHKPVFCMSETHRKRMGHPGDLQKLVAPDRRPIDIPYRSEIKRNPDFRRLLFSIYFKKEEVAWLQPDIFA